MNYIKIYNGFARRLNTNCSYLDTASAGQVTGDGEEVFKGGNATLYKDIKGFARFLYTNCSYLDTASAGQVTGDGEEVFKGGNTTL